MNITPICPYCQKFSELTSSKEIYGGRDYGMIYLCRPCNAYVGCHAGTTNPKGRLADYALREKKKMAHAAFDPTWLAAAEKLTVKSPKSAARSAAYRELSSRINVPFEDCHIGMFDHHDCDATIVACQDQTGFIQAIIIRVNAKT